jgi:RNA polymerase sigma-70 factor (ECF subfamily)
MSGDAESRGEERTEALAQRAAAGDRRAVELLIERYLPSLRAFVRLRSDARLRARESSSDVVQSVCREVLEHADRFRYPSEGAFKRWLFTTAQRKLVNHAKYHLAEKRDAGLEVRIEPGGGSGERSGAEHLLACYSSFSTPSLHAEAHEELERIEAAFAKLPEEYREVITLAHVVGLSRAEIAEEMGRSEGAVRVLLFRALARVSSLLEPE